MSSPPWTREDNAKLQELLQRAQQSGALPAPSSMFPSPNLEGNEPDEFTLVSMPGAMTDAPKRRAVDLGENPKTGTSPKKVPPVISQPAVVAASSAYAPGVTTPTPLSSNETVSEYELPTGVKTLYDWGDTVFTHGKFKDRDLTYAEVRMSSDPEAVSYVKWTLDHCGKNQGWSKDWYEYLKACEKDLSAVRQMPLIPGSNLVRVVRNKK